MLNSTFDPFFEIVRSSDDEFSALKGWMHICLFTSQTTRSLSLSMSNFVFAVVFLTLPSLQGDSDQFLKSALSPSPVSELSGDELHLLRAGRTLAIDDGLDCMLHAYMVCTLRRLCIGPGRLVLWNDIMADGSHIVRSCHLLTSRDRRSTSSLCRLP